MAGTHVKKKEVKSLFGAPDPELRFERDPNNPHDRNAIRVIGFCRLWPKRKLLHVGFVPKELAASVVSNGLELQVQPRLRMIEHGEFAKIEFDVIGPVDIAKSFFS